MNNYTAISKDGKVWEFEAENRKQAESIVRVGNINSDDIYTLKDTATIVIKQDSKIITSFASTAIDNTFIVFQEFCNNLNFHKDKYIIEFYYNDELKHSKSSKVTLKPMY